MAEVPVRRTPWTTPAILDAYATAWTLVVGGTAPRAALAALWGQASLECGRDGKSCWNANVGNIMAFASWTGDHHVLRGAPECFPADKVPAGWTVAPSNIACGPGKVSAVPATGSRFRAYASFVDGCTDKLRVLDRQWPRALLALTAATGADVAGAFVAGLLGPPRYFTGSEIAYAASLRSLAAECLRATAESDWPRLHDTEPAPAPDNAITWPGTPTSKSSQRLRAVREPIAEFDGPVGIVVPEGEHTPLHLRDTDPGGEGDVS